MNTQACFVDSPHFRSGTSTVNEYSFPKYLLSTAHAALGALGAEPLANQMARYFTQSAQRELARIGRLPGDWDHAGSAQPRPAAVSNAAARLPELYRLTMLLTGRWVAPHISASESGEISFEWWDNDRKLTLYFGDEAMDAIRVWGVNIDSEMELSHIESIAELSKAWAWLYAE
jgi:hypothetical protein